MAQAAVAHVAGVAHVVNRIEVVPEAEAGVLFPSPRGESAWG
jgi:hypothetical protein